MSPTPSDHESEDEISFLRSTHLIIFISLFKIDDEDH